MMNLIENRENEPAMSDIQDYITGEASTLWKDLVGEIENTFQSKPQITYSGCTAKPGWNVKYKKSGKALCTLYPERDAFVALVVLGAIDMIMFEEMCRNYSPYINQVVKKTALFNGTKWLMIRIKDRETANDVLKLMHLKRAAARKKACFER